MKAGHERHWRGIRGCMGSRIDNENHQVIIIIAAARCAAAMIKPRT